MRRDLLVFHLDDPYSKAKYSLEVPGRNQNGPQTIQEYETTPQKWPSIAGIAKSGETITVTHVILVKNPTAGKMVFVYATGKTGSQAGKEVDITSISRLEYRAQHPLRLIPVVDPTILSQRASASR